MSKLCEEFVNNKSIQNDIEKAQKIKYYDIKIIELYWGN